MAYSSGMLNKRITIYRRKAAETGVFGIDSAGVKYETLCTVWAAEDFNRGTKSLREGAVEAYETVMFRLRYRSDVDRWCLIRYQGKWFQIQSFNADYQSNQIQITAIEMINQNVTVEYPQPEENN